MEAIMHSDGGARGNPGPMGIGIVISDLEKRELKTIKQAIGIGTNNHAEYKALLTGLTEALAMGVKKITCFLDSELVVKQLTGLYKIKEPNLQVLASDVLKLTGKFDSVKFQHVRRAENARADQLVNQALDEQVV